MPNNKIQNTRPTSASNERDDKSLRGRLPRLRTLFDPSRSAGILFVLFAVGIYITVRLSTSSDTRHGQLRFVENSNAEISSAEAGSQVSYRDPLSGTAYETALRLREIGALGLALSLTVFSKHASTGNAPATHQEVIRELAARKLIPPGIEVENGSLRSHLSELRFSYRSQPLSFELLALPKDDAAGSALLLRFPLPACESNSVMYFESATSAQIPAPFSANEQIIAAGWRIRHWRGDALPLNKSVVQELRDQDNWMKSVSQGR